MENHSHQYMTFLRVVFSYLITQMPWVAHTDLEAWAVLTLFQARSGITFPSQTGQILPTYTFGYINPLNDFILHKTCSLTNILSFRWLQLPKTALVTKILYVAQNGYGQNLPSLARKHLFQSTFEKPVQATKVLLLLIFPKLQKQPNL